MHQKATKSQQKQCGKRNYQEKERKRGKSNEQIYRNRVLHGKCVVKERRRLPTLFRNATEKLAQKVRNIRTGCMIRQKWCSTGIYAKRATLQLREKKWYERKIEKVLQSEEMKILWDFRLQTDKVLEHSTPDIVVLNKTQLKYLFTHVSHAHLTPGSTRT